MRTPKNNRIVVAVFPKSAITLTERDGAYYGCLPFDQKTRLVDRCGKWKASKPKWEFPYGICRSIYSSKRSIPKGLELVRKSEWDAQFPFGNSVWEFWPTFQEIPFPPENFHLGRLNKSFHLHSNWNFRIFFVNGKQPMYSIYWFDFS